MRERKAVNSSESRQQQLCVDISLMSNDINLGIQMVFDGHNKKSNGN